MKWKYKWMNKVEWNNVTLILFGATLAFLLGQNFGVGLGLIIYFTIIVIWTGVYKHTRINVDYGQREQLSMLKRIEKVAKEKTKKKNEQLAILEQIEKMKTERRNGDDDA